MNLPVVTNNSDISLEMAVWLMYDEYDYIKEENYISATGLMKPLRHIILPDRIPAEERVTPDVEDFIASAMGSALHAGIEKAWLNPAHVRRALTALGYPDEMSSKVRVNPTQDYLDAHPETIPVYVEQRTMRELTVNGVTFKIGGKYDMVCDGRVTDTKSGSVWKWIKGSGDEEYKLQGSIYRWLNPDKIKDDFIRINFIFTDWSKFDAEQMKARGYPPRRVMHKDIPLMSYDETEAWIRNKLREILVNQDLPELSLPECTPEELWMSAPKFKYYANPNNTAGRSTKNFDDALEASAYMKEKGKGTIITVPGTPKRCDYCKAYPVCTQKDKYTHD